VPGTSANQQVTFNLNESEVVELVGSPTSDFSGSLVQSNKPVQVIAGLPCINVPISQGSCDHVEESVFPAETLGQHYFVAVPTGPGGGQAVGHVVRIYGNVDGTVLTYPSGAPPNAPGSIDAGEVVELSQLGQNFEIQGDHEFAVSMFQMGSSLVDPGALMAKGDPAHSQATAVEQYRKKYVFLAPSDYDENYVDIIMPMTATITLDGASINPNVQNIGSGFGVARVQLQLGQNGAHVLESTEPVGIQVLGYGSYTSYQYPGGLNLYAIAPPPPPPN
jgi:hypothetical protein